MDSPSTETIVTPLHQAVRLSAAEEGYGAFISDDWLQGRSAFGGLTAALCLNAALETFSDLPPLRSAQVSFINPAAGDVTISTRLLRQGRNVSFVQAELTGDKGLATSCIFCFGATRDSDHQRDKYPMPDVPPPDEIQTLFPKDVGPPFARNHLEQRLAKGERPFSGDADAENHIWVRFQYPAECPGILSLLAIGDGVPPAELSAFKKFAPISTVTWLINFLTDEPRTRDGWWLLRADAEHSAHGYSSQDMTGWNRDGEAVFTARQLIAIFA